MQTNLNRIRQISKWLFDAFEIEEIDELKGLGFISHPYANSTIYMSKDHEFLNLTKPADVKKFRKTIFHIIDSSSLSGLFIIVNKPYKLLWFSLCCTFMNDKDYGKYLSDCWIISENPNQDVNVSLKDSVKLFKNAIPKYLMNQEELKYLKSLPESVTVYRGVSPGREKYGLSWTDDKDKAEWFKARFERDGRKGKLLKAVIKKKNILAYFNSRDEKELVVDVFRVIDKIESI